MQSHSNFYYLPFYFFVLHFFKIYVSFSDDCYTNIFVFRLICLTFLTHFFNVFKVLTNVYDSFFVFLNQSFFDVFSYQYSFGTYFFFFLYFNVLTFCFKDTNFFLILSFFHFVDVMSDSIYYEYDFTCVIVDFVNFVYHVKHNIVDHVEVEDLLVQNVSLRFCQTYK